MLEDALIAHLQEAAPDLEEGERLPLHLRLAAQKLRDDGVPDPPAGAPVADTARQSPGTGQGATAAARAACDCAPQDAETVWVTLQRRWRPPAGKLLDCAVRCRPAPTRPPCSSQQLPPKSRGTDLFAETTMSKLLEALRGRPAYLQQGQGPFQAPGDHAPAVAARPGNHIRLHKGLGRLPPSYDHPPGTGPGAASPTPTFEPLALHYKGQGAADPHHGGIRRTRPQGGPGSPAS